METLFGIIQGIVGIGALIFLIWYFKVKKPRDEKQKKELRKKQKTEKTNSIFSVQNTAYKEKKIINNTNNQNKPKKIMRMELISNLSKPLIKSKIDLEKVKSDFSFAKSKLNGITNSNEINRILNQLSTASKKVKDEYYQIEIFLRKIMPILDTINQKENEKQNRQREANDLKSRFFASIFQSGKINRLEQEVNNLDNEIGQKENDKNKNINKVFDEFKVLEEELSEKFDNKNSDFSSSLNSTLGWSKSWFDWKPQTELKNFICAGRYKTKHNDLSVPAYIPFISQKKSIFIIYNNSIKQEANSLAQSIIMRIATSLPHSSKFSFIDPVGYGSTFPIANLLNVRKNKNETNFSDTYRVLNDIETDMRQTNFAYGLSENKTFENIYKDAGEKFEFVFAADFPNQYEARATEKLQNIANQGHIAGKYVFVMINSDYELPKNIDLKQFKSAIYIDLLKKSNAIEQDGNIIFDFIPDTSPTDEEINAVVKKINETKPVEKGITFTETVAIPENQWWQESAISEIIAPIGKIGGSENIEFRFNSSGDQITAHGIIAGTNGSGKSVLLNGIVTSFAMRYSPDELKFYLIDGKGGVEFQAFQNLPHAEIISLMTEPNFARSVLNGIKTEFTNRMQLFQKYGISLYDDFRKKVPEQKLSRILIVVDEYQVFFARNEDPSQVSETDAREVSNLLGHVVRQGRSFGIHLLLSSQTFTVKGLEQRESIFSNIPVRAALKMKSPDNIMEFEKEGRELIKKCDSVGKLVVNSSLGANGANKFGRVANLDKTEILGYVNSMKIKYNQEIENYIFNGKEQPNILENNQLQYFISEKGWKNNQEIEQFAQLSEYNGGLGKDDWYSAENPIILWLGQNYNVRGKASIVLRKRKQENIIILGTDNHANYGIVNSLIISILSTKKSVNSQIYFLDKSIKGSPWNNTNKYIADTLLSLNPKSKYLTNNDEISNSITEIYNELQDRQKLDDEENNLPNIYLFLTESQKINDLCYQPGRLGMEEPSELGKKLQQILIKGSENGIHIIMLFESTITLKSIISSKDLNFFNHRIALQMKYQNSVLFIGNKLASMLNNEIDTRPVRALYQNIGKEASTIFKPYFVSETFTNEITKIYNNLKNK